MVESSTLIQRTAPIEYPKSDNGVDSGNAAAAVDCGHRFRDQGCVPGRDITGRSRTRQNATPPLQAAPSARAARRRTP